MKPEDSPKLPYQPNPIRPQNGLSGVEGDQYLYVATAVGTILWWLAIFGEAFRLNIPGHGLTNQITLIWLTLMAAYTTNKGVHRIRGNRWGRSLGWATLVYGAVLFGLYMFVLPNVVIPESLYLGLEGVTINLAGWEFAKIRHARGNGNGNGHDGNTTQTGPSPDKK